jgi:light-regulated signal transduction histidine kinase (bacteriophytochrome)
MNKPSKWIGLEIRTEYVDWLEAERDNAREAKKAFKELCREHTKTITELEVEREQASQDYADLLKDYRALRKALTEIADGKHHGLDQIGSPAFARKTLEVGDE